MCSFNPIYGQGRPVAPTEARTLDEILAGGTAGYRKAVLRARSEDH